MQLREGAIHLNRLSGILSQSLRCSSMKKSIPLIALLFCNLAWAAVPATPVMTLYRFNGDLEVPYYTVDDFLKKGAAARPAGFLAQGTSLIPCLVVRGGKPLTDDKGTPFVGFEVVVDSKKAGPDATARFNKARKEQESKLVANHHCDGSAKHVIDIRKLYALGKAPFFDPPPTGERGQATKPSSELDGIVRAFHNSTACAEANRELIGRRDALEKAWETFMADNAAKWSKETIARAKHLDYTMRTALYEGHLERGCNAYGACERNVIALSIRNRARGQCLSRQGCRFPGDFQGASSSPSQYNIWDEFLTQISGLTSCFLRDDLAGDSYYAKLQLMYAQSQVDAERILYGSDGELTEIFPGNSLEDILSLRHYYHAPAMGKCFPGHDRVEYISGAVARKGGDFALVANTRIKVDGKSDGGYFFREFLFDEEIDRDVVNIVDNYQGFVVDGRKVDLRPSSGCPPYGIPSGCRFDEIGRYRRTPSWLKAGKPLELTCHIKDRGAQCRDEVTDKIAKVGGTCDKEMRPVAGVK